MWTHEAQPQIDAKWNDSFSSLPLSDTLTPTAFSVLLSITANWPIEFLHYCHLWKNDILLFLFLLWILEIITPATLVEKQIWTKIMLFLLVGHSAGALPLCLPNNYQWNSKTRQCVKTEEKRSSLYFVEDSLRELRKIKSTGLFSISDKKYLKCKKF